MAWRCLGKHPGCTVFLPIHNPMRNQQAILANFSVLYGKF
jgi:hypothetical protein